MKAAAKKTCARQLCHTGLSILAASSIGVQATENGGSSYPMGSENYMSGAMPPPGLYSQFFANHYEADSLRDNSGDKVPVDFRVRANAIAPRLIWVTEQQVFGGSLAFHAIAPLVDLKVELNGQSQSKQGLGDMIFGPALGFHHSEKLHSILALDFIAPTGEYDKNDLANLGRNYWVIEPVLAVSYIDPDGLNIDAKTMYDFNLRNKDTDYRSGQELHMDYAVGWGLGNGWVVGVGGYIYHQTTDDRQDGETIKNNKGKVFAIGPSVKYTSDKGWFLTAKWQQESQVRNRAEGDAYWVKLTVPF
ncbi:protein involved in meta-pathway of phenol degradation [Pseudomonas sp. GM78]|uniref:SphA family protein n=1 Tax=Pseudomonas sp. GM78 TaxID=1144337 RepID=UPI0002708AAB|nr:transporter [Pseudomonas sp. GM78]EJN23328.1 protein involved in meta-pathway of phenol degradation [Pseudomonas sp. GM78]